MNISAAVLAVGTGANKTNVDKWLGAVQACCLKYQINTPNRVAAFLAQIGVESGALTQVVENLNYSAAALLSNFPSHFHTQEAANAYARKPEKIANCVYANRMGNGSEASGDGWKYRGRGPIQITGHDNYSHLGMMLGVDLLGEPEQLEQPGYGMMAAGQLWQDESLNKIADQGNFQAICSVINTGAKTTPPARIKGYSKRLALYQATLKVI